MMGYDSVTLPSLGGNLKGGGVEEGRAGAEIHCLAGVLVGPQPRYEVRGPAIKLYT